MNFVKLHLAPGFKLEDKKSTKVSRLVFASKFAGLIIYVSLSALHR